MNALHAGGIVFWLSREQRLNPVKALGCGPVLTHEVGEICRVNALVGGRDPASFAIVRRGLLVGQVACPIVFGLPAERWSDAANVVVFGANRRFADGFVGNRARGVGGHDVLHG